MPFVRERYPNDWPAISRRIRERSGGRCECDGYCHKHEGRCIEVNGTEAHWNTKRDEELGVIWQPKVVLTVMHLNHEPMDCRDDNLRAACQRCHLTYDAPIHAKHAAETRRRKRVERGQLELVEGISA